MAYDDSDKGRFNDRSVEEVIERAQGQWGYIFQDLAPALHEAISKAPHHVACPVHGGTDGFRLFRDYAEHGGGICNTCGAHRGVGLLAWAQGVSRKDAFKEVARWLEGEGMMLPTAQRAPLPKVETGMDPEKAKGKIEAAFRESVALKGTPGELYLKNRGLWGSNIPVSLRFHPSMRYFDAKTKTDYGFWPAVVAPMTDKKGNRVTMQRLFVTSEGLKADVPDPKRQMSKCAPLTGAAAKLYPLVDDGEDEGRLDLAEGIETGLACRAIAQAPLWAGVTAGLMEAVDLPESVSYVVLWCDLDLKGRGGQVPGAFKRKHPTLDPSRVIAVFPPVSMVDWKGGFSEGRQRQWGEHALFEHYASKACESSLSWLRSKFELKGVDWLDVLVGAKGPGADATLFFPEEYERYSRTRAVHLYEVGEQTKRVHVCASFEDAWAVHDWTKEPVWVAPYGRVNERQALSLPGEDQAVLRERCPELKELVFWETEFRQASSLVTSLSCEVSKVSPAVSGGSFLKLYEGALKDAVRTELLYGAASQPELKMALKGVFTRLKSKEGVWCFPWLKALELSLSEEVQAWPKHLRCLLPLKYLAAEFSQEVAVLREIVRT